MKKHTLGPWKVEKELTSRTGEWLIAKDAGDRGRGIAIAETVPATGKELANARLIAAAADMLEALEMCTKAMASVFPDFNPYDQSAYDKARAAIAKATGAQQ